MPFGCVLPWSDQCVITRYFLHSIDNLKIIFRFICGLLSDNANSILLICTEAWRFVGWIEFTRKYVLLSEMLFECQSYSITDYFLYFELFIPHIRCFYFDGFIFPNDWHCFVRSLPFLDYVHLISLKASPLDTYPSQLRLLLTQLHSFSHSHLSIYFHQIDYDFLATYKEVFEDCELQFDTKISFTFKLCNFSILHRKGHRKERRRILVSLSAFHEFNLVSN